MDTEPLEKELQIWQRCMYMALGAAIALVASSPNDFSFVGVVWFLLQIAVTPPGFSCCLVNAGKDCLLQKKG